MPFAEFPQNVAEFQSMFATEEQCRDYWFGLRWPNGFRCPRCSHDKFWPVPSRNVLVCSSCEYHASLIAGTALEGTQKPLRFWFWAMYLMTSSKRGLSACELQRQLGMSYSTAWTWLHKLRRCISQLPQPALTKEVEVDETYVGGHEPNAQGRCNDVKSVVVCAVEKRGNGCGLARLSLVTNASKQQLTDFVTAMVALGTTAHTDGWRGYSDLDRSGYRHVATSISATGQMAHEHLPRVHRVFSLLKRWLMGTFHGSASKKHLQAYLNEYAFRFNAKNEQYVTGIFDQLSAALTKCQPTPYWKIVGRKSATQPVRQTT